MSQKLIKKTFTIVVISFLGACGKSFDCSYSEEKRVASPNQKVEYVHVKKGCGATVPLIDEVYLVPKSQDYLEVEPVIVIDNVGELRLGWKNDDLLSIQLKGGGIFKFSNFSNIGSKLVFTDLNASSKVQSN